MNDKVDIFPKEGEPTWDEFDSGIKRLIIGVRLQIVQMQNNGELPKDLDLTNEQKLTVVKSVFKKALKSKLNSLDELRELIKNCVRDLIDKM